MATGTGNYECYLYQI